VPINLGGAPINLFEEPFFQGQRYILGGAPINLGYFWRFSWHNRGSHAPKKRNAPTGKVSKAFQRKKACSNAKIPYLRKALAREKIHRSYVLF
jgi:hypothetical protein